MARPHRPFGPPVPPTAAAVARSAFVLAWALAGCAVPPAAPEDGARAQSAPSAPQARGDADRADGSAARPSGGGGAAGEADSGGAARPSGGGGAAVEAPVATPTAHPDPGPADPAGAPGDECASAGHRPGDTWKKECNTCRCTDDGRIVCTRMACRGGTGG